VKKVIGKDYTPFPRASEHERKFIDILGRSVYIFFKGYVYFVESMKLIFKSRGN
jgi:hypothetical protein